MLEPPNPIAALQARIERVRDVLGLYAIEPLLELYEGEDDPDDPDLPARRLWIERLTRALCGLFRTADRAFGYWCDEDAAMWQDGLLEAHSRYREHLARLHGFKEGAKDGYERGALDQLLSENSPRAPGQMEIGAARRAIMRRDRPSEAEAWELALW